MTRVLRVLRRSMTPGHHVVVVIGLVTAKLVVGMCTLLHLANAGPFTL